MDAAYAAHVRKRFVWLRPEGGASNELAALRARWQVQVQRWGFGTQELGPVLGQPLPLLQRAAANEQAPRLLMAAGFHGEESAAPWALLTWIEQADAAELDSVHLSLLPLVNATGFAAGSRHNALNQNPNRGFDAGQRGKPPSAEGERLIAHEALLLQAGRDGVLSCHEDLTRAWPHVYSFEPGAQPGAFSHGLTDAVRGHFELHPDGEIAGAPVRDGIVFNQHDGSFESWLTLRGVAVAATVETPGLADFGRRQALQRAFIQRFVALRSRA